MLTRDGIHLFKFYLDIGRQMQLKRFHRRRHDPLRRWKITEIDLAAISKWDDYTKAKEDMFRFTHTAASPWTVIRANDKRRTRLEAIRSVLYALDYEGKAEAVVAKPDAAIVGSRPDLLYGTGPDLTPSHPKRARKTGAACHCVARAQPAQPFGRAGKFLQPSGRCHQGCGSCPRQVRRAACAARR